MRQHRFLASGCQGWNRNVIDSGGDLFAYCSTVGVYTHKLDKGYYLQNLHTANERTITGMAWSRSEPNTYVTCSVDQQLRQFNATEEACVKSFRLEAKPMMVDSCYAEASTSLYAVLLQPGEVYTWDIAEENDPFTRVEMLPTGIKCIRWDRTTDNPRLAAGHSDGTVFIWDKETDSVANVPLPLELQTLVEETGDNYAVQDLQWDPQTHQHIVVTYEGGHVALLNVENLEVGTLFHRKTSEIEMTAFVQNRPGMFLSIDRHTPIMTMWNVSDPDAVEHIRIHDKRIGMVSIKVSADPDKFLLAFVDGSVGLYDVITRRFLFTTQPGHSETIFDCQFKPVDCNIIATASYDSTIKIWDSVSLEHINTLKTTTAEDLGQLYSVSWAPAGDFQDRLASSSSTGEVLVWDSNTQMIVDRLKWHSKPCFRVQWNPNDESILASVSADGHCVVGDQTGKIIAKYRHPDSVYGCAWSPHDKNLLATACHDGIIRVFNISDPTITKPIQEFEGHRARAFNVAWSPLLPKYLASVSDDRTVRVWVLGLEKAMYVCEGHEQNVRALVWSHEIPYYLLSGSWDGTIRVWDMRSRHQKCRHIITHHGADVYGLATHPERPFVFASSSRDTTLRIFSMDETFMAGFKYQAILGDSWIQPEMLRDPHKVLEPEDVMRMCGAKSKALAEEFVAVPAEERENGVTFETLMNFWNGVEGLNELFSLAETVVQTKAGKYEGKVNHVDDIRNLLDSHSKALLDPKMNLDGGSSVLRQKKAADIQLKLGNVKDYCEIMIGVGEWERAITIAPAHSILYWQELATRYSKHLQKQKLLDAVPYFIAVGSTQSLVDYEADTMYSTTHDLQKALASAIGESVDGLPNKNDEDEEQEEEKKNGEGPRDEVDISPNVRRVMDLVAERFRHDGKPIFAACCHLAVGDTQRAIQRLVLGDELCLAVILMKITKEEADYVWRITAQKSEALGLYHEALMALNYLAEPNHLIVQLATRYPGPANKVSDYYLKCGINTMQEFEEQGKKQLEKEEHLEACISFAAARNPTKAAEVGLEYLKKHLAAGTGTWEEMQTVMNTLESIGLCPETCRIAQEPRNEIIALSIFFALQRAVWKGYTSIVKFFAETFCQHVADHEVNCGVAPGQVQLMLASYMTAINPELAHEAVNEALAEGSAGPKVKAGASALKKLLDSSFPPESKACPPPQEPSNIIIPSAHETPGGSHAKKSFKSLITGDTIRGEKVVLATAGWATGEFVSEAEGLMLRECSPLCPTYSGEMINTFGLQFQGEDGRGRSHARQGPGLATRRMD